MIRITLLALAASLLPCAPFAQTPMLTLASPLKANSGDQNIKLSTARAPFKKDAVIKLCPITEVTPASTYVANTAICPTPVVAPPVVLPPVIPPPASTSEALQRGEAFLQSDTMTVGFNPFAGIGTLYAAPAGFRTDTSTGLYRAGIFRPPYSDGILQGRAIEGFILIVNGKRYANAQLNGFTQIAGKFVNPFTWEGRVAGIDIVQRARIEGDTLTFEVTPTNTTAKPVTMMYARIADPDQSSDNTGGSDNFNTTNTAVVGGVQSGLFGGGTFFMRDLTGKATVRTAPYNKAVDLGTSLVPGKTLKGDCVVQLVFSTVPLAPGQSVTHSFEMGMR